MKYAITVKPSYSWFYNNLINVDLHYFSPYQHLLSIMEVLSYSQDFEFDILIFWFDKVQVGDDETGYSDEEKEYVKRITIVLQSQFEDLYNTIKQDKNYLKNLFE